MSIVPRFLVVAQGEVKKEIFGAKYVDIVDAINTFIPDGGDDWKRGIFIFKYYMILNMIFKFI